MRKTFVFILLLNAFTCTFAKGPKSDSLLRIIPNQEGLDKLKSIENLYMSAYAENDEQLQRESALQMISEAQKQKDQKYEDFGRVSLLCIYYNFGRGEQLEAALPEMRKYFEKNNNWHHYYYASWLLASYHFNTGHNYTALQEAENMYNDARKRGNDDGILSAYNLMGDIYRAMKDPNRAIDNYQTAAALMEKAESKDLNMLCNTYYGLSHSLAEAGRYKEIGAIAKKWEKTIDLWKSAAKKQGKDTTSINIRYMYCYLSIAEMETGLGNTGKAAGWLQRAEQLGKDKGAIIRSAIASGRENFYMAMGNYKQALLYNDQVYQLAVEISDSLGAMDSQQTRAEILMKLGRKAEAADIYSHLFAIKDSTYSESNRSQLNEMNTLYHVKDAMMEAQRKMAQRKMLMMGMGLIFAVIIIAALVFFSRRQRKMMKRLQQANEKALESARMKKAFIDNMSHEIRTPLNIINGFTQALTMPGVELNEQERADMAQRVYKAATTITTNINNLLELSALESGSKSNQFVSIGCNKLCHIAITDSHITSTDTVSFTFDSEIDDTVTLTTDADSATKVLAELLTNAAKFTEKGHISLHASIDKSDNQLLLAVEDTGLGIPADKREKVFENFVQLDDFTQGTGTGLPMCRLLIHRLGGTLQIDPEYTDGCRIVFTLPLTSQ